MLFNSYIFVLAFMPLCLIGFYLLGKRNSTMAKVWLIGLSLWFYGYFNVSYLLIMIFSILFNFALYKCMMKTTRKKVTLITGVLVNLGVLFYFKYFDFFLSNCNALFGLDIPLKNILLPLGISFFTFQQIGFLVDAYRGEVKDCSFVNYSLFVSFFPQLIAGPIVSYDEMIPQFEQIGNKPLNTARMARGIYVFVLGMAKKVLIADTFGKTVDFAWVSLASLNSVEAFLAILFYTLQLYFDFSGYCDMAIGLGLMLDIDIPLNFNSPYKATNIIDFWKRWHITLSRFFTKTIYIPLGGNRVGKARMFFNLFIVFFLSGLWHGAGWNFILWGCMHGVLYVITRAWQMSRKNRTESENKNSVIVRIICTLLTFAFVNIAWVYFRAPSIGDANAMIHRVLCCNFAMPSADFADGFNLAELWYVMKIAHITNLPFGKYILMFVFTIAGLILTFFGKNVHELADRTKYKTSSAIGLAILLVWCIMSFAGVSTFLYFNF